MHSDLLSIFFVRIKGPNTVLEVNTIKWPHPHEPAPNWKTVRTWNHQPSDAEIATAREDALKDTRFFNTCHLCREVNPIGCMHDTDTS